ncbi:hypothetical protein BJ878DRAFT_481208 [Calycina marina]|uniref:Uncharacterized protein n=1 Tax=Calycina marina TaxID=1763456 RepID=A0A9P8CDS9_9HELO|nr:hypothetical protein BJ878DRAFT_481208 [Calycina marina]
MCVTNIFVDRYPDGREVEFRQLSSCKYGTPGRPCSNHTVLSNPVRAISFGEPTTEYIMTSPIFPSTPPGSSGGSFRLSGGSYRRRPPSPSSTASYGSGHRYSKSSSKSLRTQRKERIIIVDAPPTPRTPPMPYQQNFTAPSSPKIPLFGSPRGRPIIVDERDMHRGRAPSVGAVIGDRSRPVAIPARRRSVSRPAWDMASSSHTSFDLRVDREREERRRQEIEEENAQISRRIAENDAAVRRAQRIAEQDDEIRRRPIVPVPPRPLNQQPYLRPVVDNSQALSSMMGNLSLGASRPTVERSRRVSSRLDIAEAQAMSQRLRERQMPRRRFTVGPGQKRTRLVYGNGVYRYE